ncbi:hypothetical protein HHK36_010600 [Tetracentron sinense]|uniref:Uncharacterized protein n=1 Tax=Tetracentron sinense TaxID=13715 RepID=A0A834Z8V6_TETSI|nr:hypothetical protein HHK36_010600 [Tetracentron sinense]
MCPLRLILIFLSATVAGFFVLRNLNSKPELQNPEESDNPLQESTPSLPRSEKINISQWLNAVTAHFMPEEFCSPVVLESFKFHFVGCDFTKSIAVGCSKDSTNFWLSHVG